jgi:hypothetical protein
MTGASNDSPPSALAQALLDQVPEAVELAKRFGDVLPEIGSSYVALLGLAIAYRYALRVAGELAKWDARTVPLVSATIMDMAERIIVISEKEQQKGTKWQK